MKSLELTQKTHGGKSEIVLVGQIDENADYSAAAFKGLTHVSFNFEGISLINSTGLQRWIKFLETIPSQVKLSFEKCPVRVIGQINMFPGFMAGRDVAINSFYAPYYCESCARSTNVLLDRAMHFPGAFQGAPQIRCDKCNKEMEFDGIEKKYFLFLQPRAA